VALFRNVKNAAELRKRLISQDSSLTCALLEASLILEPLHVLLAVNRAVADEANQQLKSHNVYSEIVFGLSPATNIAQALRRFGINDETKNLMVVVLGGEPTEVEQYMRDTVHGDLVPLTELDQLRDLPQIKKYYQLNSADTDHLMPLVASAMALKG
ncbi:kinase binding protein CGI-121-domain-containing protein, partial [Syncephalastrum racemosum]